MRTETSSESTFHAAEHEQSVRAKTAGSLARFERSRRSLAGGVSSGIRRATRPYPLFFESGHGARVVDVDQNTYVDYGLAWGPLILGHAPTEVVEVGDLSRREIEPCSTIVGLL